MIRTVGISLVVLLSLIYCSTATKVCLLRENDSTKCLARGVHLDAAESDQLKVFCEQSGHVVTTRAGKVSELPFDCDKLNSSSFVWLSWNDYLGHVKTDKEFREGNVYLGRNTLQQVDETVEYCRLDMTTGHCVAENGNQNVISTDILVQRLPLRYDLRTLQVGSWKNVTELETVVLANTHLINRHEDTQFVQKVVPYDMEREVEFDLPQDLVQDVQVNVYDAAGRLGLRFDVGDAATTLISKSVPAIKRLLGRTSIEVTVKGRTERVLSKLNGDLITVFDRNDDKTVVQRFTQNLLLNRIEVGVQDVTVEYGVFVKLDQQHEIKDDDYPSVEEEQESNQEEDPLRRDPNDHSVALFQPSTVYPGFQTVSTVAYMIFTTTFVVAMFDVARQIRNGYKMKKSAYAAVPTTEVHY